MVVNMTQFDPIRGCSTSSLPFPLTLLLEEGYARMEQHGECLSISGLKAAAHVGGHPRESSCAVGARLHKKAGQPEKPTMPCPTRRHDH
jgi:hypothetical protein